MIGSIAQNIIGLIDTAFMGRVGEVELAAAALGSVYYFVMYMMAHSFNNGMQIIIARRSGEQNVNAIGKTFDTQIFVALFLILIQYINLYFITPHILHLIGGSNEVRNKVLDFLQFRGMGIAFAVFNSLFMCFFIGIGITRVINFTTIVTAAVNIFFAWIFVFGNLGFPAMGIKGAGLASSFADIAATIVFLFYIFKNKFHERFFLFRFLKYDFQLLKNMLKLATPIFFQQLITMSTWFAFFVFIEHRGEKELAVSNIIKSIYIFMSIPTWALAQTTNTMVSNLIGQRRPEDVMKLVRKIAKMNLLIAFFIGIILIVFRVFIVSIYTNDLQLIDEAIKIYPVVILASFIASVSFIYLFAVTGTGSSQWALLAEIISITIYLVYVYFTSIVFASDLKIIWGAEALYWIIALILSAGFLKWGRWRVNKI